MAKAARPKRKSATSKDNAPAVAEQPRFRMLMPSGGWWTLSSEGRFFPDAESAAEQALRISTVLACVRVLAEAIAQLPLKVYRYASDGSRLAADDHPLAMVLRRPNGWQTSFEFREYMMTQLTLRGNAYAEIRPGVRGAVSELWPLRADRMKVERLENGRLLYLFRMLDGSEERYTQDEIFHVRWMTGSDGLVGLSPIGLARETIEGARAADAYGESFFRNHARPSVVLETDSPMTEDDAQRVLNGWNSMHAGAQNAGKTAIMPFGLKAHELGVNNQDAQFLETRRFNVEEITRIYRVPLHMVNDLQRSTFSNIEHQSLEFVQHTLTPWLRRWEESMQRDLLADDDDVYVRFSIEGLLRGDSQGRAAFYREMINTGIASINEVRRLEQWNDIDAGDTHLVQGAMITLERAIEGEPAKPTVEQNGIAWVKDTSLRELWNEAQQALARLESLELGADIRANIERRRKVFASIARLAALWGGTLYALDDALAEYQSNGALSPSRFLEILFGGRNYDAA